MDGRVLVGRARELGALDALLRRAELGDRAVAVITGEPGIGKTRLLEGLAERVRALGGTVAWGRNSEVGVTPAFWPWQQILSTLETEADRAPALASIAEAELTSSRRLAWFAEVVAFLGRRATRPIALLFDDLHVADRSSLQLLEHAVPLLAGKRILIAIAARDGDASPEIATALARLVRDARRLQLGRLTRADVDALVGERADAARVFELSEGNPLFVEELVASLDAEGVARLPQLSSVREVIRERVARLPRPTAATLVAGAIVGRDFAGRVVGEMAGVDDLGAALAPALRNGMVAMPSPDRYRFSHALVAEALADELAPDERARLHLRAARVLERHAPEDTAAVAHHLLAAGHLDGEGAIAAAERAACDAMRRLAFEDAAAILERAEAALPAAAPGDRRRKVALLCARIEALQHAGEHARVQPLCAEAAALARGLDDGALFAQVAAVRGLEFRFGTTDPALVELLREALERLSPEPSGLRARLLARLAAALQPAVDPGGPAGMAYDAIVMARAHSAEAERLTVLYTATAALVDYARPAELDPLHAEVLELARRVGDRAIVVHTLLRRCFVAIERLDRATFDREAAAFRSLAVELGIPRWTRFVPMIEAMRALVDGRFDDATRAAAIVEATLHDDNARMLLAIHRLVAAYAQSAPIKAPPAEIATMLGPGRVPFLAWIAAELGQLDEAKSHLAAIGDEELPDGNLGVMVVEGVVRVGDARAAAVRYDQLARRTGEIVVASMVGFAVHDLYDRMLLRLAALAARWDVIDIHGERALAIAEKLGSPPWSARVQADWADALARRNRDGDLARARTLWTAALATARRLGMPGVAASCEAALETGSGAADPKGKVPISGALASGARAVRSPDKMGSDPVSVRATDTVGTDPASVPLTVTRHGELWIVAGFGERIHVKDSRGMSMLAQLVGEPGRALHALELSGSTDGADVGDAGPALDPAAKAAYRARIRELTEEREQAEAWGDRGRAERAAEQLEALTAELARALGLGGRDRKIGAAAERARSNVQRRIQHAVQQVRTASAVLGRHLDQTVSTGMTCVYDPDR